MQDATSIALFHRASQSPPVAASLGVDNKNQQCPFRQAVHSIISLKRGGWTKSDAWLRAFLERYIRQITDNTHLSTCLSWQHTEHYSLTRNDWVVIAHTNPNSCGYELCNALAYIPVAGSYLSMNVECRDRVGIRTVPAERLVQSKFGSSIHA